MRVLITGGTGFVGSHLIHVLSTTKDMEVFALVRDFHKSRTLKGRNVTLLKGDLFSLPPLPSDLDFVFHLAGLTKASKSADYYTVNQQGTASLFRALSAQKSCPRVIHLSSLAAAGPSLNGSPIKESDPAHPVDPYGISKLLGEKEALKYSRKYPVVILRPGAVFGPQDKDFLTYFRIIEKGILLSFDPWHSRLSVCYIKDLIKAIELSAQKDVSSGEIFNISDPRPYTWDEFGKTAGRVMGKKLRRVRLPLPITHFVVWFIEILGTLRNRPNIINRHKLREMKQKGWMADTSKAEKILSFRTRYSLEEGIRETVAWYRKKRWL